VNRRHPLLRPLFNHSCRYIPLDVSACLFPYCDFGEFHRDEVLYAFLFAERFCLQLLLICDSHRVPLLLRFLAYSVIDFHVSHCVPFYPMFSDSNVLNSPQKNVLNPLQKYAFRALHSSPLRFISILRSGDHGKTLLLAIVIVSSSVTVFTISRKAFMISSKADLFFKDRLRIRKQSIGLSNILHEALFFNPRIALYHSTLIVANLYNSFCCIKFIQVHFFTNLTFVSHYCLSRHSVALLGNQPQVAQPHIGFPLRALTPLWGVFGKPTSSWSFLPFLPLSLSGPRKSFPFPFSRFARRGCGQTFLPSRSPNMSPRITCAHLYGRP